MDRKEELKELYRNRDVIGGVCKITNMITKKFLLLATTEVRIDQSKFEFGKLTYTCFYKAIEEDFKKYGPEAFVFEILEEMDKSPQVSDQEFGKEIEILFGIWSEKLPKENRYQ